MKFVVKEIFKCIFILFILSISVFYMSRIAPGDPLKSYYGDSVERMNLEQREKAIDKLGLDKPIYVQYEIWIKNILKGDFGISYKYKRNVVDVIKEVYKNTIILVLVTCILIFIGALFLGIYCAIHENQLIDKIIMMIGNITTCIPSFWISIIAILIFAVNLKVLPTGGAYCIGKDSDIGDRIIHLILPVAVLVTGHLWYYAYMVRNKLLEEFGEDYVLLAKAKGLTKYQIVYKHCLRNIIPSLMSIMPAFISHILAGSYIVESVFSYPGLGKLAFESAKYHDYNMLMIICLITGAIVLISNLVVKIINSKVDPRIDGKGESIFEFAK